MDNLQRLNSDLDKLSGQVNDLKTVGEIFAKIKDLSHVYKAVITDIQASGETLKVNLKAHQDFQAGVWKSFAEISRQIKIDHEDGIKVVEKRMEIFEAKNASFNDEFAKRMSILEKFKREIVRHYYLALGLSFLNLLCIAFVVYRIIVKG